MEFNALDQMMVHVLTYGRASAEFSESAMWQPLRSRKVWKETPDARNVLSTALVQLESDGVIAIAKRNAAGAAKKYSKRQWAHIEGSEPALALCKRLKVSRDNFV